MNKEISIGGGLRCFGDFELQVICAKTNKLLDTFQDKNLVVNLGKENIAKLLGGAGFAITKIAVGEGSNLPTVNDTALTNAFTKNIDSVAYPAFDKVRFAFSFDSTEANGLTITELAMVNNNNQIFSRKTRAAIVKTSAILITGFWTFTIS